MVLDSQQQPQITSTIPISDVLQSGRYRIFSVVRPATQQRSRMNNLSLKNYSSLGQWENDRIANVLPGASFGSANLYKKNAHKTHESWGTFIAWKYIALILSDRTPKYRALTDLKFCSPFWSIQWYEGSQSMWWKPAIQERQRQGGTTQSPRVVSGQCYKYWMSTNLLARLAQVFWQKLPSGYCQCARSDQPRCQYHPQRVSNLFTVLSNLSVVAPILQDARKV